MTEVQEAVQEGSLLPEPHPVEPTRRGAQRVKSVALPSETASETALGAVTVRVQRAGEVVSKAAALLDRPGSLVHSQPPTFRQAWDRQMECARHYGTPAVRWLRAFWGAVHVLLVKPALNLLEWLSESPPRLIVALALIAAIWIWS